MTRRTWTVLLALSLLLLPVAAGAETGAESDVELVAATDTLYISAGCPQDTPGTCTSTRWLGRQTGDANSYFLTDQTPASLVLAEQEGPNWRDYPSTSAVGTFVMNAEEDAVATVVLSNSGVQAANELDARLTLRHDGSKTTTLTVPTQSVLLADRGETAYTFAFDIPEELHRVEVTRMTFEIALKGANAGSPTMNQAGGSTLRVPHLVPAG